MKNVFFCIAKAKRDNPNGKFFIYQLGTDRLEWIFGWIRSENGSDVNVDIYSLSTRSASAVECNAILAEKPEWDRGPRRLKLQPVYDKGAIEGKVDHINTASWKGDVCLSNVDLRSAWMSGRRLVENDPELACFNPRHTFETMESKPNVDLLNPFGTANIDEEEEEEDMYEGLHSSNITESRIRPTTDAATSCELEELASIECAAQNGTKSTVEISPGKHVHKARVLHEYLKYLRRPNSKDRLQRVANILRFVVAPDVADHSIENGTITEAGTLLIQDIVAALVLCEGNIFLALAHVNAIRVDGRARQCLGLNLLADDNVEVGIQILGLKSSNIALSNGQMADWVWEKGVEASLTVPGKLVRHISPAIAKMINEDLQPYPVYGFRSDELQELTAILHKKLALHEYKCIPKVKQSDHFPYRFEGKCF